MELSEEALKAKREYMKKWREKNKEANRKYNREYLRKWRKDPNNKEKIAKYQAAYWERQSKKEAQ